ncbi:hypothetical protein BDFB_009004 [Asbolus verrucosus]|uniref:Uncharacterized protein n=1 Tax=Asbolus verrucosus TaxID=1661398 RepID=A0A482VAU2_ASBVE|nr:hypothetical protein BDFB_009004 [Asbolus verrucosus]
MKYSGIFAFCPNILISVHGQFLETHQIIQQERLSILEHCYKSTATKDINSLGRSCSYANKEHGVHKLENV